MSSQLTFPVPVTPAMSRSPSPAPRFEGNLYFAYGSNLWQHQVARRCPNAKYIGIARLRHWRWQINSRGIANVVEAPHVPYDEGLARWLGPLMGDDSSDLRQDNLRTYGMVYELTDEDLQRMDDFQDVPDSFTKETSFVELWVRREGQAGKLNVLHRAKRVRVTFYADRVNTEDSTEPCPSAYSYKMNQAIMDALDEGIPQRYIDSCIRPFVPAVEDAHVRAIIADAVMRGVDVKRLVRKVEDELVTASQDSLRDSSKGEDGLQSYVRNAMPGANGTVTPPSDTEKEGSRRRALSLRFATPAQ